MRTAPIRLGLVGAGRWGRICLKTLAGLDGVQLAALASNNPDSSALVGPGCRVVNDWRDMIAKGDLDGVVIASPPQTHAAIAAAAMEAGIAVFAEKPLTLSAAEAGDLRDLSLARGARVFFTDHIHLFNPAYRRLKDVARQSGGITSITGLAGNHGPYRHDASVLWDWGPHDVAMILDLMDTAPKTVLATCTERREVNGGMGEMIRLDLGFESMVARASFGTLTDKIRRFTVDCGAGQLIYDDLAPHKLVHDGQPVTVEAISPLSVALGEFAEAIRDGGTHRQGLILGVKVVEVLEQAQATLIGTP